MSKKNSVSAMSFEMPKKRTCGVMPVHERLLRTIPEYANARANSENNHFLYLRRGPVLARTGITVIPVVVHVVHNTDQQNITDEQIQSQIDILNQDYRMANTDISSIPAQFQSLAADARIEFELAKTDPDGNPTNGITRTHTTQASFTHDDGVKSAATGGIDPWPSDKYLNVWVCQLSGGLLGYAQFPGGPSVTDGVVILHSAFGSNGTATAPFNLGRTATHEIGHWLNLRHIWGDDGNGCNGSDFVDDTPNQGGPNYGTPTFPHVTCNNEPDGDLFMDYMDYVDDISMFMFTPGQVDRMQACLDSDRSGIGYTKPGPTLKFRDDQQPTLKFRDDQQPTLKFRDDQQPTLKFRDDQQPTLKFRDDQQPTLKFRDDQQPTLKFRDDQQPTLKFRDDIKIPNLDKVPQQDQLKQSYSDNINQIPQYDPAAVPFVLSTPHHSKAWMKTFPESAQATIESYKKQIAQYEALLQEFEEGDKCGQLTSEEKQYADQLYADYTLLIQEYSQFIG